MSSLFSSLWEYIWGDAEKKQLLEDLVSKGVPPEQAAQAVQLCPRTADHGLLLHYMIVTYNANAMHAVQAVIAAKGHAQQAVRLYNQQQKQTKLLRQLTDLGIPAATAQVALQEAHWDAKVAHAQLQAQKKAELHLAKREYEKQQAVYQRLLDKKPKATKAQRRHVKHARFRGAKQSKKVPQELDVGSSSDEDEMQYPTMETNQTKPAAKAGYHSSDDEVNDKDSEMEQKEAATPRPSSRKPKLPGTRQKRLIFEWRQKMSPTACRQLAQALQSLDADKTNFVAGCAKLQTTQYRSGLAAQYCHLLMEYPSLRDSVQRTLENRS